MCRRVYCNTHMYCTLKLGFPLRSRTLLCLYDKFKHFGFLYSFWMAACTTCMLPQRLQSLCLLKKCPLHIIYMDIILSC